MGNRRFHHRFANIEDCEVLAELNHQLIQDEGHRNPMGVPELAERMRGWLATDYRASIFEDDSGVLAYALYREDMNEVHIRQFFVERGKRRTGIGLQCMKILLSDVFPQGKRITVDVLCKNSAGIAFWRKVGFINYSLSLEITPAPSTNG